jgi:hypothetical protein
MLHLPHTSWKPIRLRLSKAFIVRVHIQLNRLKSEQGEKCAHSHVAEDVLKDEYEDFDDYIEMTIQFGYVTMFAAAMPIAATIAFLYTFIEMRADLVKIVYLTKRPKVNQARTIGVWASVVQVRKDLCLQYA